MITAIIGIIFLYNYILFIPVLFLYEDNYNIWLLTSSSICPLRICEHGALNSGSITPGSLLGKVKLPGVWFSSTGKTVERWLG